MRHAGQLFLSRTQPQAGPARCGTFQLQLLAYDRIGPHQTEPWRIVWTGIAAKRFWQQHEADLNPGAVLNVTLEAAPTPCTPARPRLRCKHGWSAWSWWQNPRPARKPAKRQRRKLMLSLVCLQLFQ